MSITESLYICRTRARVKAWSRHITFNVRPGPDNPTKAMGSVGSLDSGYDNRTKSWNVLVTGFGVGFP